MCRASLGGAERSSPRRGARTLLPRAGREALGKRPEPLPAASSLHPASGRDNTSRSIAEKGRFSSRSHAPAAPARSAGGGRSLGQPVPSEAPRQAGGHRPCPPGGADPDPGLPLNHPAVGHPAVPIPASVPKPKRGAGRGQRGAAAAALPAPDPGGQGLCALSPSNSTRSKSLPGSNRGELFGYSIAMGIPDKRSIFDCARRPTLREQTTGISWARIILRRAPLDPGKPGLGNLLGAEPR